MDIVALVEQGASNPFILMIFAMLLGALHGLEPGHSKTMMAAFVIAVRGTVGQAVLLGLSAAAFFALTIATQSSAPLRGVLSVSIGVGAIYFWVARKAKKRMSLIEEQLPDAVELMVRSLRVGQVAISSGSSCNARPTPWLARLRISV